MRALLGASLASVICAVACSVTHTVNARIEVTRGATVEAKQALAASVTQELFGTVKNRIQRRVPAASAAMLDGLGLRANTVTVHPLGGQATTSVFIECALTHDGSIADGLQNEIIDACKAEVQQALDATVGAGA